MKFGFFSDVHANLEALKACIVDFQAEKLDKIFFLGDAVGYGPYPNECIELINNIAEVKLMGNHDYAALGLMDTELFNQYAAESMGWTRNSISQEATAILADFQLNHVIGNILLVHSSPREPEMWHYILDMDDAVESFDYFSEKICLIGHTHRPFIVVKKPSGECELAGGPEEPTLKDHRYLINIGSVGQPRDGDPRSCYLIYDKDKGIIKHKRVQYNIKSTQKDMARLGLPGFLIERLSVGR